MVRLDWTAGTFIILYPFLISSIPPFSSAAYQICTILFLKALIIRICKFQLLQNLTARRGGPTLHRSIAHLSVNNPQFGCIAKTRIRHFLTLPVLHRFILTSRLSQWRSTCLFLRNNRVYPSVTLLWRDIQIPIRQAWPRISSFRAKNYKSRFFEKDGDAILQKNNSEEPGNLTIATREPIEPVRLHFFGLQLWDFRLVDAQWPFSRWKEYSFTLKFVILSRFNALHVTVRASQTFPRKESSSNKTTILWKFSYPQKTTRNLQILDLIPKNELVERLLSARIVRMCCKF